MPDQEGVSVDVRLALQRSEERYHKMVEEVEDYAILMLDSHGHVLNWNKGAEKIKGYKEQEIVGNHFRIFYPEEDRAAGLPEQLISQAKNDGKAIHEGWRIRKDGTSFWGSVVITALHDENRRVIGFSKVTRDLTERKLAEDKLLQYARQLELQNQELQQFAYAAAHDMKEPLRKIQFYYSAILNEEDTIPQDRRKAYLRRSAEAAKRMQGLIDDLLSFAKISEPLEKLEPVDLNVILAESLSFYQETIDERRVFVNVSTLPAVKGIPFQLSQLFLNLLGNALKYQDQSRSLRIDISYEQMTATRHRKTRNHLHPFWHKISIQDNGIGFEPKHSNKIFELFQRLHGREKYAGSGIGLSICRKIMENHNGSIVAIGNPGIGARFDIYFPG
jgi:PAS domain S-box-containing protein